MKQEYRHMMEQAALSTEKKEEILAMFENQNTGKRRMPKAAKLVLAAALAAGCVLSIAAGLPAQVYNFVSGGQAVIQTSEDGKLSVGLTIGGEEQTPIVLEDGRLWFVNGGERTDITDRVDDSTPFVLEDGKLWFVNGEKRTDLTGLIDENTPFVYEHTDPATGNKGYLVLGGTPEDFGWAEFFLTEEGGCSMTGENAWINLVPVDGKLIPMTELTQAQRDQLNQNGVMGETVNRPWLSKALEQLGLDWD